MSDLLNLARALADRPTEQQLNEPRRYRRRKTWIPRAGEKVTVWRALHDPDREIEHKGVYISETDDTYFVHVDGEELESPFARRDDHGAILWRLDSRGTQHTDLEMNK
jgi:hypothetical protein